MSPDFVSTVLNDTVIRILRIVIVTIGIGALYLAILIIKDNIRRKS